MQLAKKKLEIFRHHISILHYLVHFDVNYWRIPFNKLQAKTNPKHFTY